MENTQQENVQQENEQQKKIPCRHQSCTKKFKTHSNRSRHKRLYCKLPPPVKRNDQAHRNSIYDENKSYRCYRCAAEFKQKKNVNKHIHLNRCNNRDPVEAKTCQYCSKEFAKKSNCVSAYP